MLDSEAEGKLSNSFNQRTLRSVLSDLRKSIEAAVWETLSGPPCTVGQVGHDTTLVKALLPSQSMGAAPTGACRVPSEPLSAVALNA